MSPVPQPVPSKTYDLSPPTPRPRSRNGHQPPPLPIELQMRKLRGWELKQAKIHMQGAIDRGAPAETAEPILRVALWLRDGGRCRYCGRAVGIKQTGDIPPEDRMSLDHIVPVSRGGAHNYANTCTCCKTCNQLKGDLMPDEWTPPLPLI